MTYGKDCLVGVIGDQRGLTRKPANGCQLTGGDETVLQLLLID